MAKVYNVHIVAKDADGNEVKFVEVVAYPDRPATVEGAVPESQREPKAIRQVQGKCPHLQDVRAEWSRHI